LRSRRLDGLSVIGIDAAGFHEGGEAGFLDQDPSSPTFLSHPQVRQPPFGTQSVDQRRG